MTSELSATTNDILTPPSPPQQIKRGAEVKFDYVKTKNEKEMLETAYKAISQTELWDFVEEPIACFTFSNDPRVTIIFNKIEELGYKGHSGFSFGWTMRAMQTIARHGEEHYRKVYLKLI